VKEWVSGRNPVYELLRAGRRKAFRLRLADGIQEKGRLEQILVWCRQRKIAVDRVPRAQLDSLGTNHQGVAVEAGDYPYVALPDLLEAADARGEPPFLLVLDALQDPQNLGALLRTAESVGVHGVLLPLRRTALVTPAVVHASSGACEHLLIAQANLAQALQSLKERGVWVMGLEGSQEAQPIDRVDLRGPLALVVGSEGEGMRSLVRSSCDVLLRLPMKGQIESLNAAVAGSIALYFAWQARGYT
jgi:23S rRNA (guanosine2251-2'-O)-methyltransferase